MEQHNTTSLVQPLDFRLPGVAYAKDKNKDASDSVALNASDVYSINQLTVINYILQSWERVKPTTISNCFRHTTLL
ncbi:hypothetical protein BCV71DRAFT_61978 [Rhizopus microsporus]|uniref:Uncharacterized protein n=1 Tax=Rhizopus microsporus TaxID=58291 RepID=A0A1X0RP04_RHIZD|nr:hypothetical protein BCV71DRAFT_61978 [Rhizopus microsporus]